MGQGIINSKNATRIKGVKYAGTLADGQVWVFDSASGNMIPGTPGGGANIYTADGTLTGNRIMNMGGNILTFDSGRILINQTGIEKVELNNTLSSGKQFINFNNDLGNTGAIYQGGSAASSGGHPLYTGGVFAIQAGAGAPKMIIGHDQANPIYFTMGVSSDLNTRMKITNAGTIIGHNVGGETAVARLQVKGSGSTSGTTALLVRNSAGSQLLKIDDSGGFALGLSATYSSNTNVAVGTLSNASGTSSISVGYSNNASGNNSIAIGVSSNATTTDATAVGAVSTAGGGIGASSFGRSANATGQYATAFGAYSTGLATGALSVGVLAASSNSYATALGYSSTASGLRSLSIGNNLTASATNSIIIGGSALVRTNATANSVEFNFDEATSTIRIGQSVDSWINTSANFGIGHAAPTAKLHVVGSTLLDGNLGVFGTTPIAQPTTGVAPSIVTPGVGTNVLQDDTFDGYTVAQVVKALRNLGILA